MSAPLSPYQLPKADIEKEFAQSDLSKVSQVEDRVMIGMVVYARLAIVSLIVFVTMSVFLAVTIHQTAKDYGQDIAPIFVNLGVLGGFSYDDVQIAHPLSFFATLLFVALWKRRSMKNALVFRKAKTHSTISPGWAVGWYFIPGANLWKPYLAMREIVMHTTGEFKFRVLIGVWWLVWLVWFVRIFFLIFGGVRMTSSVEYRIRKMQGEVFNHSCVALAGCLLIIIIVLITRGQMREIYARIEVHNA